jgi:RNA polymerase sigma-70 factor, ECF subfamily
LLTLSISGLTAPSGFGRGGVPLTWKETRPAPRLFPGGRRISAGNKTPPGAINIHLMGSNDVFAAVALPHLDAAFNLARWLTGSAPDAEDVVQEAMVRALTYFPTYRGGNARAWILQIVRNTAYGALAARRGASGAGQTSLDEAIGIEDIPDAGGDPEKSLLLADDLSRIDELIAGLPVELRETLVLRELEELSYREIAQVTAVPIGTVMSRLWRARRLLVQAAAQGNAG